MEPDIVQSTNEVRLLKTCINDLLSIQTLPAIWDGGRPSQIVGTLLDVLLVLLHLDFAYAKLKDSIGEAPFETFRVAHDRSPMIQPQEIGRVLDASLGDVPRTLPFQVRNPIGDGNVSIVPLGQRVEMGVLVTGSVRVDFPTAAEKLLLNVAANQVVMALHEVRRLREKEELAHELDQRVAERTKELVAVNEELKREIGNRTRAEEDLRRSEAYLAEAQRLSQTGSFGWSVLSGEIYWSEETYNIFEYDRATKATLQLALQRIHPDDRELVQQTLERASNEGTNFDIEHRLLMPDGSVKHLHVLARALETPSGNLEFVGAVTDVTAAKRAEEALRRSESYLAEAQRLTHTGSWAWRVAGGDASHLSEEWYRIYGFDPEEGLSVWEQRMRRTHPEDRAKWQAAVDRAISEKSDYEAEFRIVLPDGTVRYIYTVGHPVLNACGDLVQFVGSATDITERKQAEEKIRQSESYLAEAQRLTHTGSWVWKVADRDALYLSEEWYRIYGFDPEEGMPTWEKRLERIHPADRTKVQRTIESAIVEKSDYDVEFRILLPDGVVKCAHTVGHPILNASGELVQFVGSSTDITERKRAEDNLQNAFDEIKKLKDQLYKENIALREEIDKASMFEEIVGISPALHAVLSRVCKVAPTDSTVLITGETGTGKELVARAVHKRSQRCSRAFVSVNCAAVPRDLIASELFGHEKGAFTGATQRRLGRFELAEGGTIFLDEVGELPAETQIALLRVLQEHEFERVGGTGSIRTNVRVIAATNRDLQAAIVGSTFRSDLFYRLNVFPIEVPPLRKRQEDIPLLVEYFIDRYARKAGKSIRRVNKKSLELLQSYPWPGNIRELQNVIERSVIVCDTENFSVDESWLSRQPVATEPNKELGLFKRLPSEEKAIIEAALREAGGRVSGPSGAAAKLGIPGSTLDSKIRSLKINKNSFKTTDPSTARV